MIKIKNSRLNQTPIIFIFIILSFFMSGDRGVFNCFFVNIIENLR